MDNFSSMSSSCKSRTCSNLFRISYTYSFLVDIIAVLLTNICNFPCLLNTGQLRPIEIPEKHSPNIRVFTNKNNNYYAKSKSKDKSCPKLSSLYKAIFVKCKRKQEIRK